MVKRYYNENCKILQLFLGGIKLNEKITILIADDNPEFAETLVEHLSVQKIWRL